LGTCHLPPAPVEKRGHLHEAQDRTELFFPSPLMNSCVTIPALLGAATAVFLGIVGPYLLLFACGGP
jgi:hypothetical protein